MYAVLAADSLIHLGDNADAAFRAFRQAQAGVLGPVVLTEIHTLDDLAEKLSDQTVDAEPCGDDGRSNAFRQIVERLREMGVDESLADKVRSNSEKFVEEARGLGIKGLRSVGDGFKALGEMLKKAADGECCCADDPVESPPHRCCGGA